MKPASLVLTMAACIAVGSVAGAEDMDRPVNVSAPRTGWQLALGTGVAIPLGSIGGNDGGSSSLSKNFSEQVPVFLEVGVRVVPRLFLGGYAEAAFGEGVRSSGSTLGLRFGLEGQYHFFPEGGADPWVGYGFGYEKISRTSGGGTHGLSGLEFARLMGGIDLRVSRTFSVGPYVGFSVGRFSYADYSGVFDSPIRDMPIGGNSLHEWLAFGVRGVWIP